MEVIVREVKRKWVFMWEFMSIVLSLIFGWLY